MNKGWRFEGYRHFLAARGINTSMLSKKSRLLDERYASTLETSGVPTSEQINEAKRKANEEFKVTDTSSLTDDQIASMSEEELDELVHRQYENMQDYENIIEMIRARKAAKQKL